MVSEIEDRPLPFQDYPELVRLSANYARLRVRTRVLLTVRH